MRKKMASVKSSPPGCPDPVPVWETEEESMFDSDPIWNSTIGAFQYGVFVVFKTRPDGLEWYTKNRSRVPSFRGKKYIRPSLSGAYLIEDEREYETGKLAFLAESICENGGNKFVWTICDGGSAG
jgi:hypothetical protein